MEEIKDFNYKKDMKVSDFVEKLGSVGYQSIHLKQACDVIKKMKMNNAKIILTFTSNMGSSGLRGFFAQLLKLKFVDLVITTVGAIEEDVIKAKHQKFFVGSFNVDDLELAKKGINRIGNIFVPNEAYASFEDVFPPILEKLYQEKSKWTPSQLIKKLGEFVQDENSIVYQANKNNIPIFCPAITDGAFGMQTYFFQQRHNDFEINVVKDIHYLFNEVLAEDKVGTIVLGGGVAKHHAILANLMRNGMEYAVYMTTANAYAGSLSGATTEEAKSWGKIKGEGDAVTVIGDVSITFPLVMTKVLDDLGY